MPETDAGVDAAVGGEPDASVAPAQPEGQFLVGEAGYAALATQFAVMRGSILDPRPQYHELVGEEGPCRLWRFEEGSCGDCAGVCNAVDECVVTPPLQAGTLAVTIDGVERPIPFRRSGYLVTAVPANLFQDTSGVAVSAPGSDEVGPFSMQAQGVDQIVVALEEISGSGSPDTLLLVDGTDLEITWAPAVPGARVRLEILSTNGGLGQPTADVLTCEAEDTGSLVVPRALVEAFPRGSFARECEEEGCPSSSLTRFRSARADAVGRTMELRVESSRLFNVVHQGP